MLRSIFLAAIFLGSVTAGWNDTWTGIDLDKLQHFPLVKLRSGVLKDGSSVTLDRITATAASGDKREVVLRGTGKSGRRWEAHLCCLDEVWRADLDGNGTQDYVFFTAGPYFNGRTTPPFSLTILLMDDDDMPVPFFTVVYHGENGAGIKHLVDLNHDRHAELLISTYDENGSDPRVGPFSSGHWTNQLYRFRSLGAEEIQESMGGITFPFIHNWTDWGKTYAESEIGSSLVRPATIHQHGTSSQGEATTTIRKVDAAIDYVTIDPVAGCKIIRPNVVVYDRPALREIAFPNLFDPYQANLAEKIRRDGKHVKLRGIDNWIGNGECSVNLMWAG